MTRWRVLGAAALTLMATACAAAGSEPPGTRAELVVQTTLEPAEVVPLDKPVAAPARGQTPPPKPWDAAEANLLAQGLAHDIARLSGRASLDEPCSAPGWACAVTDVSIDAGQSALNLELATDDQDLAGEAVHAVRGMLPGPVVERLAYFSAATVNATVTLTE
jgi:hypothetical protein